MVFSDLFFLFLFFPVCLLLYYRAKGLKNRNTILIIFSLIFYAWGEPIYILLLLFSAVFNWFFGRMIGRNRGTSGAKAFLVVALVVNIGMLLVFKYTGFFVETINGIFRVSIPVPAIRLPIGISFYTFQALSYILDVFWETVEPQQNFKLFLLYLSLFPQLIAGPIVRYSVVQHELASRKITITDVSEGLFRVIVGLTKKVIIANNLYVIVDSFFGDGGIRGLSFAGTWYAVIVYAMYVYFDFSGYSDMAIGMGRMFGFHFNENFDHPFMCRSIAEFWQRWHISLGSFFRDYLLYVPIFGKRRAYWSLFLVWFCTGMWHGASWNFIVWGLYFGFWIFFEQKMGKKKMKKWPTWWRHIYSKLIIVVGFGIFYFESFRELGRFFLNISGVSAITKAVPWGDPVTLNSLTGNVFLIAAAVLFCFPVRARLRKYFLESKNDSMYKIGKIGGTVVGCVLLVVCAILLVDATNNVFLYWRF